MIMRFVPRFKNMEEAMKATRADKKIMITFGEA